LDDEVDIIEGIVMIRALFGESLTNVVRVGEHLSERVAEQFRRQADMMA
jgi:hypothetical protein